MAESPDPTNPAAEAKRPHRHLRRALLILTAVLVVLAVGAFFVYRLALRQAEPILRQRVVETLTARFNSRVELAEFHVSVVTGLSVFGRGLKIYPYGLDSQTPLFAVDEFNFHTTWQALTKTPMHVGRIYVSGLAIHLPPKEQRRNMPKLGGTGGGKISIAVDELIVKNATLVLGPGSSGKPPLDFEISQVTMHNLGQNQPWKFDATLVNPKPVGDIRSQGSFGPWVNGSPGDSPVEGKYSFSHADLGTLKGISGILSSTGTYQGTLNHITVDGETDTPDFRVSSSGHAVSLHTTFHAIVDGTNGDTWLEPVDATLLHSHFTAAGKVVRVPGVKGHDITLNVVMDKARIEDMLRLGVKTDPPILTGPLTMNTTLHLPPGDRPVPDKLELHGKFAITNARFNSEKIQARVNELSMRSQGRGDDVMDETPGAVTSQMHGAFDLRDSRLTISGLNYDVPGANISMDGVYTLDGKEFDFHGKARLKARVSQIVGGWKGILLKPIDPIFAKNGAGTEVPIKITGTQSEPKFGLDFGHKDKEEGPVGQDSKSDKLKENGVVSAPPHQKAPRP